MIKLIALDIDGTLLNAKRELTDITINALIKAQLQGVKIVLSSARPIIGILPFAEKLKLNHYGGYISAFNSGEIIDTTTLETIHIDAFDKSDIPIIYNTLKAIETKQLNNLLKTNINLHTTNDLLDLHQLIDQNIINIMTYHKEKLIYEREDKYIVREALVNNMQLHKVNDFKSSINFDTVKFLISSTPMNIDIIYPKLKAQLNQYDVTTSDPQFIEITPKGINKGAGINFLMQREKITNSDVIAFGDSFNDVPMLQIAGIGIAMGNAKKEVKSIADFTTLTHNQNGIADYLIKYVLK